jgi:hypothetical protein
MGRDSKKKKNKKRQWADGGGDSVERQGESCKRDTGKRQNVRKSRER